MAEAQQQQLQDQPAEEDKAQSSSGQIGVQYVCGDCGRVNLLRPKDPVRCENCAYRILYKMRTKRLIQFEAR